VELLAVDTADSQVPIQQPSLAARVELATPDQAVVAAAVVGTARALQAALAA
jgi:hypothetical protein